ncbi:MAG: phenylacetate--CoA ligase [Fibromonadaceae bacterium]|jgi:phenylacetate-CoA ligase|nr:phenylacetate--CoA ligase [Fibromonadaceae bacterium]
MMNCYEKEIETMPRESLERLQLERLQTLVGYVYEKCDFYRKKMDEYGIKPANIKCLGDLKKLPFTTKQDLRDNYPYGMFSAPMSDIVRIHASSGTTGKLTVAGYTQNDIDIWSNVMARSLASCGCSHSSIVNVAYGYGLFTGGLGAHYGSELLGALTIPASSGNTKRQLQMFKDFKVTTLCCTPSYALYLADEMKNEGYALSDLNLKQGLFGAEPWSEEMRQQIQSKLGLKAYNIYGLSEIIGPGVSIECEHQNGSHIWEDHFLPEIIDPKSLEPLGYGEQGELVFTTISKTGMPLIRYRTSDLCSLIDEPCKCGRTHICMTRIIGRSDDMLIIGGVNVFPSQIESALFKIKEIEPHYQIIVERVNNLDKIKIQVEIKDELFSDEIKELQNLKNQLEKSVSSAISISVKIHFVNRGTIERSQGKAVRVIDKRRI